jgi:hypothetical protein
MGLCNSSNCEKRQKKYNKETHEECDNCGDIFDKNHLHCCDCKITFLKKNMELIDPEMKNAKQDIGIDPNKNISKKIHCCSCRKMYDDIENLYKIISDQIDKSNSNLTIDNIYENKHCCVCKIEYEYGYIHCNICHATYTKYCRSCRKSYLINQIHCRDCCI